MIGICSAQLDNPAIERWTATVGPWVIAVHWQWYKKVLLCTDSDISRYGCALTVNVIWAGIAVHWQWYKKVLLCTDSNVSGYHWVLSLIIWLWYLQDAAVSTWLRELQGGSMLIVMLRTSGGATPARLDRSLTELGLPAKPSYYCWDVFSGSNLFTGPFTLTVIRRWPCFLSGQTFFKCQLIWITHPVKVFEFWPWGYFLYRR